MNPLTNLAILSFLLAIVQNSEVLAIVCRQCSMNHPSCASGDVRAAPCPPQYDACSVIRVYAPSGQGVWRRCHSTTPEDSQAQSCVNLQTARGVPYIKCTLVCDWPRCNGEDGTVLTSDLGGRRRRSNRSRSTRSNRVWTAMNKRSLKAKLEQQYLRSTNF